MPELPDLQVFSKNLTRLIKGKTLEKVVVHSNKIALDKKELKPFEGKKLTKVFREGKKLFFDFGKDAILSVHLMLHGKLVYSDEQSPKYALISFHFSNGKILSVTDFQKMAKVELNPPPSDVVDALSDKLTPKLLSGFLQKSKTQVKSLLMDQNVIGGIGNAYADEILFDAGIAPMSVSNKIPEKETGQLVRSIKRVLTEAEEQILEGHPDIISGEVRDFMKVHNAKLKFDAHDQEILKTKIGGRSTYYTQDQKTFE